MFNRETCADDRRLFNRATRAIKRYVIPLARDKKLTYSLKRMHKVYKHMLKIRIEENSTMNLYSHINIINCAAIDVFFTGRVGR